jgi:hypothetical protein
MELTTKPVVSRSRVVDREVLKAALEDDALPKGTSEEDFALEIRRIAADAHRRMIMDECGGLPGPPVQRPSLTRRILRRIEKITEAP